METRQMLVFRKMALREQRTFGRKRRQTIEEKDQKEVTQWLE